MLSIVFGILAMGRLVGMLDNRPSSTNDQTLRIFGIAQQIMFVLGVALLVIWFV
jgi:hypothetical protein